MIYSVFKFVSDNLNEHLKYGERFLINANNHRGFVCVFYNFKGIEHAD